MAGWKKILIGIAVVGCILLVALLLLVKIFVTPERVRDLLQSGLETSLQRKVTLGRLDVGLFRGINLEKVTVASKTYAEPLLEAENIELSYDFSALLTGKILFSDILINNPKLRLMRSADGLLNTSDLIGARSEESPQSAVEVQTDSNSAPKSIPLLVSRFRVRGGTVHFIDRKLNSEAPYLYRLENLEVGVEDFSLDHPFHSTLVANLNGSPLSVALQFDFNDGLIELKLRGDRVNLIPLLPYLQEKLPGKLEQGFLSSELQITKQQNGMMLKGQVVIDEVDIGLDIEPRLHWKQLRIAIDQDLIYRFEDQVIDVRSFLVDINGAQSSFRGKASLSGPVQIAGEAHFRLSDLRTLSEVVPEEYLQNLASLGLAGSLDSSFQLQGEPGTPSFIQKAQIQVTELQSSVGALRPSVNGTFDFADKNLRGREIKIDIQEQHFFVDLDVSGLFIATPSIDSKVSGELLDIDSLLQAQSLNQSLTDNSGPKVNDVNVPVISKEVKAGKDVKPFPVTGHSEFRFAKIRYRDVPFTDVQANIFLKQGKLNVNSLDGRLSEGAFKLIGESDLTKPSIPFAGQIETSNVRIGPIADILLPEGKGSTTGTLSSKSLFSGEAGQPEFLSRFKIAGDFALSQGEIKGSPLFSGLARFLTNPEFEVLGFQKFFGKYSLAGRSGTLDAQVESRTSRISPKGVFSLDGPINLSMETRISPESKVNTGLGGQEADLLKDENGWSLIPLKVKGSYDSPRFSLDSTVAKKQLKEGVTRELGKVIQKKLGGDLNKKGSQEVQQLLDGTLKKLFGN